MKRNVLRVKRNALRVIRNALRIFFLGFKIDSLNKTYIIENWNKLSGENASIKSIPNQGIGEKIYVRKLNTENIGSKFIVDSFTVDELIKRTDFIGEAYELETNTNTFIKVTADACSFMILLLLMTKTIKKNRKIR